ncbi:porin [Methylococcus sp. EFPC2]|uniref:porin n=1 Tax=Methylococcus sp. EFPC2 TaxID=2812648 RepID=UPI0019678D05|nr:porin [Methylococcus sp. EFPC2]QSA96496.1 porin [Methylococcus sp. EFPC2]
MMKTNMLNVAIAAALMGTAISADALELFVDTKTGQVYTTPGKGRTRLGEFQKVDETAPKATAGEVKELESSLDKKKAELEAIESRLDKKKASFQATEQKLDRAQVAEKASKDAGHVKLGENGLEFESNDGNFKAKIGGRIQVDSQVNFNDDKGPYGTDLANNVGFRRARIYTEGTLFKDYEYKFEYDWARNGGGTQGITEAFIKYVAFKPFAITVGQQNEGKGMEAVGSANNLTFTERGLPTNALIEAGPASKYQLGITAETFAKLFDQAPYTLRGGITTESIGAPAPGNSSLNSQGGVNRNGFSGDIGYQLVGRATIAPYKDKEGNLIHTGAWGSWRSLNNNYNKDGSLRSGGWQFQSQPDTNMDRTAWINTGNLTNGTKGAANWHEVDDISMFGAELAGAYGPAHLTAEYMRAEVSGRGYSSDVLEGFYTTAGYFLTGETRPYDEKRGSWGRVIPKSNFIGGSGWGAWEVAARYDVMDMNTKNIHGGSLSAGTLGVNWYLTPRVRLMTNWVHVFNTSTASAGACSNNGAAGKNASLGCYNGLSPDVWETAVRVDY